MRAITSELNDQNEIVVIDFEGSDVPARKGETIAAALIAANVRDFRITQTGKPRGLYCGMGACYECLMEINGVPNQRACMTTVQRNTQVRRQIFFASYDKQQASHHDLVSHKQSASPDILVIGGGAGGLNAAALSAEAGASVMLIDERSLPGGQFFKQPLPLLNERVEDDPQYRGGRHLIQRATDAGVTFFQGMVWGIFSPLEVSATVNGAHIVFSPKQLIVATGAYERSFPVPGWTLPGVMTTGAAQTMLRSYGVLPGERVLIAGNGPLNFQVAIELVRAGAEIKVLVESSPKPSFADSISVFQMASSMPHILWQGFRYHQELKKYNIQTTYNRILENIHSTDEGLSAVVVSTNSGNRPARLTFDIDAVLLGYGFNPANELLGLIGVRQSYDKKWGHLIAERDNNCQTTHDSVFAVGDCCGLRGAKVAEAEGVIAAGAAIQKCGHKLPFRFRTIIALARLAKALHTRFQTGLWDLFGSPSQQVDLSTPDTIICRCEEVFRQQVDSLLMSGCTDIGEIKRVTRLGMGRCQGRYCGPLIVTTLSQKTGIIPSEEAFFAPRTPTRPTALRDIVSDHYRSD